MIDRDVATFAVGEGSSEVEAILTDEEADYVADLPGAFEAPGLADSVHAELGGEDPTRERLDERPAFEEPELEDPELEGVYGELVDEDPINEDELEGARPRQDPNIVDIAERVAAVRAGVIPMTGETELQAPARSSWTACFSAAEAARTVRVFEDNATAAAGASHDRCSCIVMLNVALAALLDLRTKDWPARGYKPDEMPSRPRRVQMADLPTGSIERAMGVLVRAGRATGPVEIDFTDSRGKRAGTLAPVTLASSVQTAVMTRSPDTGCWYGFGLSLMDGYHSLMLLVDHTGVDVRIYWMDQFSQGLGHEVTNTLDAEITAYTQRAWQSVLDTRGKRFSTPVRLWSLRKRP